MTSGEPEDLERSLAELLRALGWPAHLDGTPYGESPVDGRASWFDEILDERFRTKVHEINPGADGRPWLDDERLERICDALLRSSSADLVEANEQVTQLLLQGVPVEGLAGWDEGKTQVVKLVDWDHPGNNDLLVVTDFRLDRPYDGGARFVVLDAVLFVNGIPFAVVEGVRPDRAPTVAEAIDDLRSYTGQRPKGQREDTPSFFRFVQLLVATDGEEARLGTITSTPEYYTHWRTVEPASRDHVLAELGRPPSAALSELETIAAGVLRPADLLDLVRNFTVFFQVDGRKVKLVARYPQFRAVHRMTRQLLTGRTRVETGHDDERGGVVWHTQGSGKSFTMTFLVRKMRTIPQLAAFKIVVIVDRTDLREQLQESLALAGETPIVASGEEDAQAKLAEDAPGIVTIMIQHAQRDEGAAGAAGEEERFDDDPLTSHVHFPELNTSEQVVLLVDEAHRSQRGRLHARVRHAMPNAARIGFTGTPLLRADKESHTTTGIFGDFIDQYRLRDSEEDGATVPIRYEQRQAEAHVIDRVDLDAEYEREVGGTERQRADAQRRWLNTRRALESDALIRAKARDMLRHWVETVLPGGFKAQVVAVSRLAAVRYRDALLAARDELVAALDRFAEQDPTDSDAIENDPDEAAFLRAALPYLPLLRIVDFVPVISAGDTRDEHGNRRRDPPEWRQWTDESRQRDHVARFKQRLPAPEELAGGRPLLVVDAPWTDRTADTGAVHPVHTGAEHDPWGGVSPDDNFARSTYGETCPEPAAGSENPGRPGTLSGPEGPAPVAFLIVQSMLLTGFDAPVEQVLYLDRAIRDVELLQAIARTNRPARLKEVGLVVDYAGVSGHLEAALSSYDESDLEGYKEFLVEQEVPVLRDRYERVRRFLAENGVGPLEALDDESERARLVVVLADPQLRTMFDDLVRAFLTTLDVVLPRPEALGYEDDAKRLGLLQYQLRRTYRDTRSGGLDPYRYGAKVRRLLNRHIRVTGIAQRIPPMEIYAADFLSRSGEVADAALRALQMEHALRQHISQHRASDPVRYERLSERLERVLDRLRDDDEQRARALKDLIREEREAEARPRTDDGLKPFTGRPIHNLLEERLGDLLAEQGGTPAPEGVRVDLVAVTHNLVELIRNESSPPHFLDNNYLQERLRKQIRTRLVQVGACEPAAATPLAGEIVQVVRSNWRYFHG